MKIRNLFVAFAVILTGVVSTFSCSTARVTDPETARRDSIHAAFIDNILQQQSFLFMVSDITLPGESSRNLAPKSNFILIEKDKGLMQINTMKYAGPNNIGGFTSYGDVLDYQITDGRNGAKNVKFNFSATTGHTYIVDITVKPGGRNSSAIIRNSTGVHNLEARGNVVAADRNLVNIGTYR